MALIVILMVVVVIALDMVFVRILGGLFLVKKSKQCYTFSVPGYYMLSSLHHKKEIPNLLREVRPGGGFEFKGDMFEKVTNDSNSNFPKNTFDAFLLLSGVCEWKQRAPNLQTPKGSPARATGRSSVVKQDRQTQRKGETKGSRYVVW